MKRLWFVLFYLLVMSLPMLAQIEPTNDPDQINNDSRREEIQRYFGYEDLFFRYTTLPYDISQNTNENAIFLDIGFLYITFLPLMLVLVVLRRKTSKIIGMLGLTLYLFSCLYYSKIISSDNTQLWTKKDILEGSVQAQSEGFVSSMCIGIYKMTIPLFDTIINLIGGVKVFDNLTYIIVILGFLGSIFLALRIEKRSMRALTIIYLCFCILFFLLSAGIIWYGFLIIPVSLFIIFYLVEAKASTYFGQVLKYSFYSFSGLWILFAVILRISNIQATDPISDKGKNILFSNLLSYSVGHANETESIEMVFPNLNKALAQINNNNELVYRVGTSLSLHIEKNNQRLYNDSQLAMFHSMYRRFGKDKLFPLLKEYGFGYIIVDLHTASIDRTPDQSLTKKYQLLLETIFNNRQLQLLATDKIIQIQDQNGQTRNVNGIFGKPMYDGSYAIFKLL